MDDHQFFEGKLPSAYRYNFEPYLFNREEYRMLQSASGWISFYILNERELAVEAHIHFYVKNEVAQSSIQSPFGGIDFSEAVDNKVLFHFIEFVCEKLKSNGIKSMVVSNPPHGYDPSRQALLETFLINQGFTISTSEVGSIIPVTDKTFLEILHPRKKRKLTQTLQSGLKFELLSSQSVDRVYQFIETQRKEKNYQLSISLEHLKRSVEKLGKVYVLFGVFDGNEMLASSVAVQVSKNILYHFISDHVRKVGETKPALVLMNGIYNYCLKNNIRRLDLGTSAKDSQPNFKLLKFKSEIGGHTTHKFTFTKRLA